MMDGGRYERKLGSNGAQWRSHTEELWICDLDEVDVAISAEGLDEFDVLGLGARLNKNAQVGLTFVEGFCTLAETTSETIVLQGILYHLLYQYERDELVVSHI